MLGFKDFLIEAKLDQDDLKKLKDGIERWKIVLQWVNDPKKEVEIDGVVHEYSTIEGVREDVIEILLNLKGVAVLLNNNDEAVLTLSKKGAGTVTAGDIAEDHDVEIVNPDHVIANLNTNGELSMRLTVRKGRGYSPADSRVAEDDETRSVGKLPLDASYLSLIHI